MMLSVDHERECVEALSPADQTRMAMHALAGWRFTPHAAGSWLAKNDPDWYDQYGSTLKNCLDQIDNAILRHEVEQRRRREA